MHRVARQLNPHLQFALQCRREQKVRNLHAEGFPPYSLCTCRQTPQGSTHGLSLQNWN